MDAEQWRVDKASALVVMPARAAVPLPCPDLPEVVLAAVAAIQVLPSQQRPGCRGQAGRAPEPELMFGSSNVDMRSRLRPYLP